MFEYDTSRNCQFIEAIGAVQNRFNFNKKGYAEDHSKLPKYYEEVTAYPKILIESIKKLVSPTRAITLKW